MKKFTDIYIGLEEEVIEEENKPTNPKSQSGLTTIAIPKIIPINTWDSWESGCFSRKTQNSPHKIKVDTISDIPYKKTLWTALDVMYTNPRRGKIYLR